MSINTKRSMEFKSLLDYIIKTSKAIDAGTVDCAQEPQWWLSMMDLQKLALKQRRSHYLEPVTHHGFWQITFNEFSEAITAYGNYNDAVKEASKVLTDHGITPGAVIKAQPVGFDAPTQTPAEEDDDDPGRQERLTQDKMMGGQD